MRDEIKKNAIILHLEEIRKRILVCLTTLLLTSAIGFRFVEGVRRMLLFPAEEIKLIYTSPAEAFVVNIRVAIFIGIIMAMPMFIAQFLAYILPALYRNEKRVLVPTIFSMLALFIVGVIFSYKIAFPFTIKFFLQFASSDLIPMFTITEYISFAVKFLLSFGIIFQLPLLFVILGLMNVVNPSLLSRTRKYVILILAIIAAVITPPDAISQLMVLLPLWLLYEISILLVKAVEVGKMRKGRRK